LFIDGQSVLVRVTSAGDINTPHLNVYLVQGSVNPERVLEKVGDMLGVDADMRAFYQIARADERLWRIVEPLYGVNHVRAADVFEALVTTIIEQQIALSMAQRAERWLVEWIGNRVEYEGEHFYTFPTPTQIARLTVDDLKPLKITNKRMAVLIDIARQIESGGLAALTTPQIVFDALVKLHGIGRWTAAWTVIRAFGKYEYIGENDVALQAAINYFFYDNPAKTTPQIVKTTLERYGSFAGTVAFFTLLHWGTMKY
jgi:DNA-3-methyladenine glycosylase II